MCIVISFEIGLTLLSESGTFKKKMKFITNVKTKFSSSTKRTKFILGDSRKFKLIDGQFITTTPKFYKGETLVTSELR